jgi:hypothetical protein
MPPFLGIAFSSRRKHAKSGKIATQIGVAIRHFNITLLFWEGIEVFPKVRLICKYFLFSNDGPIK